MTNPNSNESHEEKFNRALRLRAQGRLADALTIFLDISENHPQKPHVLGMIGVLYQEQGDLHDAIEYFKRVVTLSPRSETASLCLFHALWDEGKHNAALDEMKRFLAMSDSKEYQEILKGIRPLA